MINNKTDGNKFAHYHDINDKTDEKKMAHY